MRERLQRLAEIRADAYGAMSHDNLKITFHMSSPIGGSLPWISFDSILAYAVLADILGPDVTDLSSPRANELIPIPIPVGERGEDEKRYYAASFGVYEASEAVSRYRKRWDERYDDLVDFWPKRAAKVQIDGLHFKARDLPLVYRTCDQLIFYVRGNQPEIERLLKEHITHVGKLRGHGWGRIARYEYELMEEDQSCWWGGHPTRPIPMNGEDRPALRVSHCGFRPPYWAPQNQTMCWVPGS